MMKRRSWSMLLAGSAILLILLSLIWLTFDAVGGTTFQDETAPSVRLALTPDEVLERLETAANFDTIGQDFADGVVG